MKDNKLVISKIFKVVIIVLIIIYLGLFIANNTGYYSFSARNRKELTEQQIKKFEEDVKNGVDIDINDYLSIEQISYQNNISSLGYNISNITSDIIKNGIYKIFDLFSDLINE